MPARPMERPQEPTTNDPVFAAPWWLLPMLALGFGLMHQVRLGYTPDVSWLISVNERILQGEVLYLDLWELNPPFSVWLYRLPVLLAQAAGIPSEWALHGFVLVANIASFAIAARILVSAGILTGKDIPVAATAWFIATYLFAGYNYAQREYFGLLGLAVHTSLVAARFHHHRPRLPYVILAGAGAALMVAVKPHYVLAIVLPVALLAFVRRSIRPFFNAENLLGAALVVAYVATAFFMHPDYFGAFLERLSVAYLPSRTWMNVFLHGAAFALLIGAGLALVRFASWQSLVRAFMAAAIGQIAGTVLMGRAFPYHVYPAFVLGALALLYLARTSPIRRPVSVAAAAILAVVALGFEVLVYHAGDKPSAALVDHLRNNHSGAKVLAISTSIADSLPLIRLAGGTSVASGPALLITAYGRAALKEAPEHATAIADAIGAEHAMYRRTINQERPEIILIPTSLRKNYPDAFSAIWEGPDGAADLYEREAEIDGVEVLVRRNR